ncbi:VanZ family protein [bacterium SCSIO 12696]|nr:VanZ family protein [bacterium SCSIO 12696]
MSGGEPWFPHQDKLHHGLAYVYFYGLGWWALFYNRGFSGQRNLALLLLGYGILIELLQGATGYRSMEWLDLLANILGIGTGWLLVRAVAKQLFQRLAHR